MIKLNVSVRNLDGVQAFLKSLPRGTMRIALAAFTEYAIGDDSHGLRKDEPYAQTTRKKVYGQTFESDKQRRYVMAALDDGRIKIGQRQQSPTDASQGYGWKETNNGYGAIITNTSPGAYWSRVWGGWKNWRSVPQVVADNMRGGIRHALAMVNVYIKQKAKAK